MNLKNVIIFEDDFIFTLSKEDIDKKINMFLNHFKNDWDVVHLTSLNIDSSKINDINFVKKVNFVTGGIGYIVNNTFFDKLEQNIISSIKKMEKEMEEWSKNNKGKKKHVADFAFDQYWNTLQKKSKWYIFDPVIGNHSDNGKSSIMGGIESFFNFKQPTKMHTLYI
jgi:hypothetical protein